MTADAATLARAHAVTALAALVDVMTDTTAGLDARVEAARTLLEPRRGIAGHPGHLGARDAAARFLAALAAA